MAGWLLFVHLTALLCLPFLNLPVWLLPVIVVLLIVNLANNWRRLVIRCHPDAIRAINWPEGETLTLTFTSGRERQAGLVRRALILPWLVIIRFDSAGYFDGTLLLTPDMLPADAFRRLRVRLRMTLEGTPA